MKSNKKKEELIFEAKTDCFAYMNSVGACSALTGLYCKKEGKCRFYKPQGNRSGADININRSYKPKKQIAPERPRKFRT